MGELVPHQMGALFQIVTLPLISASTTGCVPPNDRCSPNGRLFLDGVARSRVVNQSDEGLRGNDKRSELERVQH